MLFVSRHVFLDKVAIVDTDDGVEQVVGGSVYLYCQNLRVEVKGLERQKAVPYQDPSTVTVAQTKILALQSVDIRVWNGMITYVNWGKAADGVTFRLSDFGMSCADNIFDHVANGRAFKPVIILDDKLKYDYHTFWHSFRTGAKFDIREMTNDDVAGCLYREWVRFAPSTDVHDFIIDHEERTERWKAVCFVCNPVVALMKEFSPEAKKFVDEFFKDEFSQCADMPMDFTASLDKVLYYYRELTQDEIKFWGSQPKDTDAIEAHDRFNVFTMLAAFRSSHRSLIKHFNAYMRYFEPCDEFREYYAKLCSRVYNWVITVGEGHSEEHNVK